jgi:peptidyl-prolyl cis-trans isomerase A (cyclophilin A)
MQLLRAAIFTACTAALFGQTPVHYDLFAHFNTSMGEIVAQLYPESAPRTVANFVALAEGKKPTLTKTGEKVTRPFYNGLIFHRVIKGFMIQTGQVADGRACGVPNLRDEIDPARSFATVGALAMANAGRPNTGSCQIFITVAPQKPLDGDYTLFGQVVSGQDVADQISEVPVKNERPVTQVIIKSVTIERRSRVAR